MSEIDLRGRSVLVVEDEYVVAAELTRALGRAGASVLRPVPTVDAALDLLEGSDEDPQAAVLDVNLDGELVYPVADALLARNIPFAFASGYEPRLMPERHAAVRWLDKPLRPEILLKEVGELLLRFDTRGDVAPSATDLVGQAPVAQARNHLIGFLPATDQMLLLPYLERVTLRRGDIVVAPPAPIAHVYFPESGMASEIALNPDGNRIEVGCVGREGLAGASAILGVDRSSSSTLIQVGGAAVRIAVRDLRNAMERSRSLRELLLRYVHVHMTQIAATALADGRYRIEQRLARWLLMAQDRIGGNEVPLTHELLALMLGVRRPGVTDAIHVLEGEGIVKAKRARIYVRDRARLEEAAGGSYGAPEAEYRRLIGEFPACLRAPPAAMPTEASRVRANDTLDA